MSQDNYCLVEAAREEYENKLLNDLHAEEKKTLATKNPKPLNSTDDSISYPQKGGKKHD
jgi:hypothetical protein